MKSLSKLDVEINCQYFNVYNASYVKVAEALGDEVAARYFKDIEAAAIKTQNLDTRICFMLREWDEVDFDLTKKMDYFSKSVNKFLEISRKQGCYNELQKTMVDYILKRRQEELNASGFPKPANDNQCITSSKNIRSTACLAKII